MARTNASNFTRFTLAADTGPTSLTFDVGDTAGAPDAPFYIVVNLRQDSLREVVKVDSKDSTTFTVDAIGNRYLEGSAASSGITHPTGSQILLAPVAQNLEDLWDYASPSLLVENLVTANYTLALSDASKVVAMNSTSARTVTVPTNASVAFPIGTVVNVYRVNTGAVNVVGASGVTVRNAGAIADLFGEVSLRKRGTDEWVLAGRTA
jgi:hypothetical protein